MSVSARRTYLPYNRHSRRYLGTESTPIIASRLLSLHSAPDNSDRRSRLAGIALEGQRMDHRVRLIAAAAVIFAGLGIALCFRRGPGESQLTIAQGDARLQVQQAAPRDFTVAPAPQPRSRPVQQKPRQPSPTIVSPNDVPAPPPEFPQSYPGGVQPGGTRWGTSLAELRPEKASPATHKIADGDTLPALAERYLGSASRAMEIYRANRNVLEDPNLLPVGKVLKMPSKER